MKQMCVFVLVFLTMGCTTISRNVASNPSAPIAANSPQSFNALVEAQPTASLYQVNADALDARLALLDNAPAGATVKIATFVFDYGSAVKKLAGHMCLAASKERGVHVELLVDAKSGDRVGEEDVSDSTPEIKSAEEIYQLLANCGVKVHIHNLDHGYVNLTLIGGRIPNIFPNVANGGSVSPLTLLSRIGEIKARFVAAIQPELKKLGVRQSPAALLNQLQQFVLALADLAGKSGSSDPNAASNLGAAYRAIIKDPFWDEMNIGRMQALTTAIRNALEQDPDLAQVFLALRRANRLNHRKIFLVQSATGEGCAIIGGRNLGDHYLVNSKDNFRDGDVMVCSAQAGGIELFKAVDGSFEQLKTDMVDPMLNNRMDNRVRTVERKEGYQFKFINPAEILSVAPIAKVTAGIALAKFEQPLLLTSSWKPNSDGVRMALLEGITREQKEIYIESAYAEFNGSLRRALEKALKRGVRVRVVTNSFFVLDGPSKAIRLWMADWNSRMAAQYPKLFTTYYATEEAGHMIHFKGAGFRCQKGLKGLYRMYMIGSHNFHPRSGYSDKENTLQWREQTNSACDDSGGDLIDQRIAYWHVVAKGTDVGVLHDNASIYEDFALASRLNSEGPNGKMAQALIQALFRLDLAKNEMALWENERVQAIIELLEEGGLRDLIGVLL